MPIYFIRSSYGKWSSGTQVEVDTLNGETETVQVHHAPTGECFRIPKDKLVLKRNRNGF